MALDSLGTAYSVFIQDVEETKAPMQLLISGGFNDELILAFAEHLKSAPFFQGWFDSPDPVIEMKVAQITQLEVTREVPLS